MAIAQTGSVDGAGAVDSLSYIGDVFSDTTFAATDWVCFAFAVDNGSLTSASVNHGWSISPVWNPTTSELFLYTCYGLVPPSAVGQASFQFTLTDNQNNDWLIGGGWVLGPVSEATRHGAVTSGTNVDATLDTAAASPNLVSVAQGTGFTDSGFFIFGAGVELSPGQTLSDIEMLQWPTTDGNITRDHGFGTICFKASGIGGDFVDLKPGEDADVKWTGGGTAQPFLQRTWFSLTEGVAEVFDPEGGGSVYTRRHTTSRALPYELTTSTLEGVPWHETTDP